MKQIRFDYCTVAGKNPASYIAHVQNVLRNAGLDRDYWTFHTAVYQNSRIPSSITDEIMRVADDNGVTVHPYIEVEGEDFETWLFNLYSTWHICQIVGDSSYNIRAGSDQAFGPSAFAHLIDAMDEFAFKNGHDNVILFNNCIECKDNVSESRHILESMGKSWDAFDEALLYDWCAKNEEVGLFDWHRAFSKWCAPKDLPGCPMNQSPDGCSWIMSKQLYRRFGPMIPRDTYGTGDISLMMRIRNAGVPIYIVGDSTTYHLSRCGA